MAEQADEAGVGLQQREELRALRQAGEETIEPAGGGGRVGGFGNAGDKRGEDGFEGLAGRLAAQRTQAGRSASG